MSGRVWTLEDVIFELESRGAQVTVTRDEQGWWTLQTALGVVFRFASLDLLADEVIERGLRLVAEEVAT